MRSIFGTALLPLVLLSALPVGVLGGNILSTDGFSTCVNDPTVEVQKLNVTYNKNTRQLVFDVAGASKEAQNVTATMVVSAYGKQIYTKQFSPCDYNMQEMCPSRSFADHWMKVEQWHTNFSQYLSALSHHKASRASLKNTPPKFPPSPFLSQISTGTSN